jgi:hypothetical protein
MFTPSGTRDIDSTPPPDRDVAGAGLDQVRGEVNRLLPATALPVDGCRGNFVREVGREQHVAGDVGALLADLVHAAEDDVFDHRGLDTGALHNLVEDVRAEIVRVHAGQCTAPPSHGGADGFNNDCFSHWVPPSGAVSGQLSAISFYADFSRC